MIISWNLRGLNNVGKLKEISSHLLKLRPTIAILIETRVKNKNAKKIRDKLKLPHNYLDNYKWYDNGRLWIEWEKFIMKKERNISLSLELVMKKRKTEKETNHM